MHTRLGFALLAASFSWGCSPAQESQPPPLPGPLGEWENTVFESGSDGYHTYRIPALIKTKTGSLLAFCEGRISGRSDSGDIDLLMRRSTDFGQSWGPMQVVWNDESHTCGNPCPVIDRETGRIILLMTHNLGDDHESEIIAGKSRGTRTVWVTHSDDDGLNWSPPRNITAKTKQADWTWYATGPGVGIQLASGRLVVPCDHIEADTKNYYSHTIHSDDGGKTWSLGGRSGPQMNECQVVELADGRLLLNMRNYKRSEHRARGIAFSEDRGQSWSTPRWNDALIEPRCQASLISFPALNDDRGTCLLFSNPAHENKRLRMRIKLSHDSGKTWPLGRTLHEGPSAYSCLALLADDGIGCLFEAGEKSPYEQIRFTRVLLKTLSR
ncbi:MAG: sialidase family protein [Planctomycetota bacterium]|nr:sialidase family protein [Planctomycetota bacterium]